jgi:NADH-quinone oxidoreductase subunit D
LTLRQKLQADLKNLLGKDLLNEHHARDNRIFIQTSKDRVVEVAKYLVKDLQARLIHITVTDIGFDGFEVTYFYALDHVEKHLHIIIKTIVPRGSPEIATVSRETWQAAWAEREIMDFTRLKFKGHPDPRALYLPYEWPNPVESEKFDESRALGVKKSPDEIRKELGKWVPLAVKPTKAEANLIPIGPYHPMLIESTYFRVLLDGEEIVDADIKVGFNHRGIMKLFEGRSYWRGIYLSERVCGICSHSHSTAYCRTVEYLAGVEITDRAKYIRTLVAELERIHSHLLWFGVAGDLIGYKTLFMLAFKERENVLDILELISGGRVHHAMNTLGGVRRDIKKEDIPKIERNLKLLEKGTKKLIDIAYDQPVVRARLEGVGILDLDTAKDVGVVGPTARGSNWKIDARWSDPYAAYESGYTTWDVVVEQGGDVWARTLVRLKEILVSVDICNQCIEALKKGEGKIQVEIKKFEPGEAMGKVEALRGELVYYIVSDGSHIPYSVRIRTPSYRNNPALPFMLKGQTLADAPIIIGSIDPCYGCTDRTVLLENASTGEIQQISLCELAVKGRRCLKW